MEPLCPNFPLSRHDPGFTLIEVMVAIMLMAIVSLMAWRGLDSIARASAHLEDSTEQGAALLRALNQLERDIALHSAIREETGLPSGDEPIRASDSLPPGLALKRLSEIPLRLDIVRASTEPGAPLQRVRWWRQGKVLYRAASPSGDRLPLPPLAERVAVLDDVSRFEIRAWVPGKGWTRLPARSKVRASGLEISLSRVTRNGVERYRRVVALQ
ncbi:PulJ/GspJ family protein [Pseudomonas aeruginosa]|uniref:PulJ/GspJ family protein n=3 Tax=Pseudomonas aeruginosa TaxID=287 RepID=UPI0031B6A8D2